MRLKQVLITIFFLSIINSGNSQVYLGIIQKEGILLSETVKKSKIPYEVYEKELEKLSSNRFETIIFDNIQEEFVKYTNIQIGDKYYVSCSENTTRESVSGYIIYTFLDREFYPLISNKNNLCKINNYDYSLDYRNLVILSEDSIFNKINIAPMYDDDLKTTFRERIFQDAKNFEVYTDYTATLKEKIKEVLNDELTVFRGSFCNKFQEEYFVSYKIQNETEFVNANYVMNSNAKVIEFFTTPRKVFEYREIIGICDYDNDGLDEILISIGYYEGGGYELWKFDEGKFIMVAEGFYFGV